MGQFNLGSCKRTRVIPSQGRYRNRTHGTFQLSVLAAVSVTVVLLHAGMPYDTDLRIPFTIVGPGIRSGFVSAVVRSCVRAFRSFVRFSV